MKILQTPARLFSIGGVENYVSNLSREIAAMGHEVGVICADTCVKNKVDSRICVKTLKSRVKIANTNITLSLPRALFNEDFDIIHTHLPTPWSADLSAIISKIKGKPLVLTYHSDITGQGIAHYIAGAYNLTALQILIRRADKIIVTRHTYLSEHLRNQKKKIAVIPIGVDSGIFRPIVTKKMGDIFFLCVLDEYHEFKGLDVLLGAVRAAKRDLPDIKLIVGGDGALKDQYKRLSRSMGIEKNVVFVGYIPDEQLTEYYNSCSMFVLPSIDSSRETFGIVLLEAMACGRPVVTTQITGPAEDINKYKAGLVVSPRNEKELAEAILCILKNPDLAGRMGFKGRKLAEEKYNWKRIADKTVKLYEELV